MRWSSGLAKAILVVSIVVSRPLAGSVAVWAQPSREVVELQATLESLAAGGEPALVSAAGLTRNNTPLWTLENLAPFDSGSTAHRLVLVGGLDGNVDSARMVLDALRWFKEDASEAEKQGWIVSALPLAEPMSDDGRPPARFPPVDGFFDHSARPESRYLWRWVTYQAPDLVVEFRVGADFSLRVVDIATNQADGSLAAALVDRRAPEGLGSVETFVAIARPEAGATVMREVLARASAQRSGLRAALAGRIERSPLDVARVLAQRYPETPAMSYIPALAWVHTLRLARLTGDTSLRGKVLEHIRPWVSGEQPLFGDTVRLSAVAGTMVFGELQTSSESDREVMLRLAAEGVAQAAAERSPGVPQYGSGWSDDLFLGTIAAVRAGDTVGLGAATRLILHYAQRLQQPNGLFQHAVDAPVAWGRGNGFAALGLAESLTYIPESHPERDLILNMYTKLMEALKPLQEPSGMYRQLIDFPGAYHEFTSTSMIGYSMTRGIRLGWIDNSYLDTVHAAWTGIKERIDEEGNIVDGCTGSGVMDNRLSYLDRPANSGYDDRSGSMALWFAAEIANLER